jgi:hypothetical protein
MVNSSKGTKDEGKTKGRDYIYIAGILQARKKSKQRRMEKMEKEKGMNSQKGFKKKNGKHPPSP